MDERELIHVSGKCCYMMMDKIKIIIKGYDVKEDGCGKYFCDGINEWITVEDDEVWKEQVEIEYENDSKYDKLFSLKSRFFSKYVYCNKTNKQDILVSKWKDVWNCERNDYIEYKSDFYRVFIIKVRQECSDDTRQQCRITSLSELKKPPPRTNVINIAYDCETIANAKGIHSPYILYAKAFDSEGEYDCVDKELFSRDNYDSEWDLGFLFSEWIRKEILLPLHSDGLAEGTRYTIRITGFNNFRFDDNFVLEHVRQWAGTSNLNKRFGKVTNCVFRYRNVDIEFVDLITWIPDMSLRDACDYYELNTSKMEFNIVEYNNDCKKKKEFIKYSSDVMDAVKYLSKKDIRTKMEIKKKYSTEYGIDIWSLVKDYCIKDVEVTIMLYQKIEQVFKGILNELTKEGIFTNHRDFMRYWSIPQFANNIYKQMRAKEQVGDLSLSPDLGRFINKSYFGGRVWHTFIGSYYQPSGLEYQDVTSEYALAMKSFFPYIPNKHYVLEEYINIDPDIKYYQDMIDKIYERRKIHKNEKRLFDYEYLADLDRTKFIFMCDIYMPANEGDLILFAPVPTNVSHATVHTELHYLNCSQKNRILNSTHVKTLLLAGWRVELKQNPHNIVWKYCDTIFLRYIELIGKMKSDSRMEGNKALGKLLKRLLTALYGKQAQRVQNDIHSQTMKHGEISNMRFTNEKWDESKIYNASFICAEANWIIFSTMYRLSATNIYMDRPLSFKCGQILYCDTDSICFDPNLCDSIEFKQSEYIGNFNIFTSDFDITWKQKYGGFDELIVLGKKSYFVCDKRKVLSKKLKGVHTSEVAVFDYKTIKQLFNNKHGLTIDFEGLSRVSFECDKFSSRSNYAIEFFKDIKEVNLKKTISMPKSKNFIEMKCTNEIVLNNNNDNLSCKVMEEYISFLIFISSNDSLIVQ
jgi:hypothetical protein